MCLVGAHTPKYFYGTNYTLLTKILVTEHARALLDIIETSENTQKRTFL